LGVLHGYIEVTKGTDGEGEKSIGIIVGGTGHERMRLHFLDVLEGIPNALEKIPEALGEVVPENLKRIDEDAPWGEGEIMIVPKIETGTITQVDV
jgi:hypothetical protein